MNFKTTYILFGVLALLLAVAAFSLLTGPKPGEEGLLLSDFKRANIQAKDVTRVVIERKLPTESRMVFVRVDKDRWKLEEPYPGRVDSMQIENLINDLLSARKETKNVDLTSNLSQFGLDLPAVTVRLVTPERDAVVNLGKLSFGSADSAVVYATSSENPKQPAAVRRSSLGSLLKDNPGAQTAGDLVRSVGDFRPRNLILDRVGNAVGVVKTVRLKGDKGEIVINKTSDGRWQYEKPPGFGDADVDGDTAVGAGGDTTPSGVRPLLDAISRIQGTSGDDTIENVTDFAQYGLAPGKEAGPKIEIVRDNPAGSDSPAITETLSIGKKEDKGDKVYVRPGDETAVVKVSASAIEPITKLLEKPAALRDRNLLAVAATAADGVDVQVGSDPPLELRKVGEPPAWRIFNADGSSVPANAQAVMTLLNGLGAKRSVKDFPEKGASETALGFDHPSATVTLWVGGILPKEKDDGEKEGDQGKAKEKGKSEKEEKVGSQKPKMKDPTAKLIFGKTDKDLLYVRRVVNGVSTDLALAESVLAVVRRGRLDYLDTVLPSFVVDQATKLSFTAGGETVVVEKQKKDDKAPETWVILQPSNLAGRPADLFKIRRILGDLAGIKAERLWAEKATDKELERFGLKPPKATAVVTLKEGDNKERTYLFGNDGDDKTTVYAKQGERDLVFAARKSVVEALQQADVADPTIFTLDLSKVRGMKLTGWKEFSVNGQPQTLDLERKVANDWAVKGSGGYKLSSAASEAFLLALQTVRAEKVVAYKSGPKPEHKLTPDAGALVVELTVEGEREPITLAIGALDADGKNYFATSNKLPGDVFLLSKDRFEKYKTKPNAFAAE
jgi:Domain of unknown function (DUF4340)